MLGATPTTVAQAEPVFHLPFTCDETWVASTRDGHSPSKEAVDFSLPDGIDATGRPVRAGADGGTVSKVGDPGGWNDGNGDFLRIAYPGGVELLFAHLQEPTALAPGDPVDAQTVVGKIGATGDASGPRLNYEQLVDGVLRPVVIEGKTWELGIDVADDIGNLSVNPGIAHLSQNCASSAIAPSGKPLSRPAALPARVPWRAGEARRLISSYDADSPDGFGITTAGEPSDTVYPVYPGEVIYAGCATGRSAPLGRIVVIRQTIEERTFDAIYGHLSAIDPSLVATPPLAPPPVGPNDPIGRFGSSVTDVPLDSCDGSDGGPSRLYVGILRDATISPQGEISGGRPVYAEPLVGKGVYEKFTWWRGPVTAIDVTDTPGAPSGRWANKATKDGTRITYGDPVTLMARVKDVADLRELRFTAYYPGWARKASASQLPGFNEKTTWRILAICRPPGVKGTPAKTEGCKWDGNRNNATVTYKWDPTKVENGKATPWAPRVRTAIGTKSTKCVPVTLSFDVFDASGFRRQTPGGVKRANKCPGQAAASSSTLLLSAKPLAGDADSRVLDAKAPQQNRWVYLDPLRPPVAPENVRLVCRRHQQTDAVRPDNGGKSCITTATLRWEDRSDNEQGFHIYVRWWTFRFAVPNDSFSDFVWSKTSWSRVATVSPNTDSWVVTLQNLPSLGDIADLRVASFNRAGESRLVGDARGPRGPMWNPFLFID